MLPPYQILKSAGRDSRPAWLALDPRDTLPQVLVAVSGTRFIAKTDMKVITVKFFGSEYIGWNVTLKSRPMT